jgi:hypothetical protein
MSLERQIAREIRKAQIKDNLKGEGMYVFENNTKGDLYLPRPTQAGRRLVPKGAQFIGDNYYFAMLRTNELKLIKELQSPEQEKLLTEQPPTVTHQGTVEHVQQNPQVNIHEQHGGVKQDVLLTESPVDGIKIIR